MLSFNNSEDKGLGCGGQLLPLVSNVFLSRERREMTQCILPTTSTQGEAKVFARHDFLKKLRRAHPEKA